ncbi:DUF3667 domain-containing protein [Tahibacter soli]|uniref:DUF3667 domain-containing protein n=1 Tax=Tahibacter soli TaxID=2983605 RepID=A0A9X4BLA6_9GAMM|nr:DUF3667 domain-containing protein [Tahibacter soli]MDC8015132.1 DUF3667 domain-containing protein [Tahibacter soli]
MNAPAAIDAAHYDAPVCRNCGAALATPFCGACGQERARRLGVRAAGREAWNAWRLFELKLVKAAANLVLRPGTVARDYVLGKRTAHPHPAKLLAFAIGVLLVVLARANYLDASNASVGRAMALVRGWSNLSFSLGIVAVLAASFAAFGRRGYNATEHLVLAAYCQTVVIAASVLTKLPMLAYRAPAFLAAHKAWSAWALDVVGCLVVAIAFKQFFLVDLRRDGWRLALAVAVFLACKWTLVRAYARVLAELVAARAA